jgi:ATP-binding cassette subfamily B protein
VKDNNKLDSERFLYQSATGIISAIGFGISLWLIVEQVLSGKITIGTLVFVVSALGALITSLNVLLSRLAGQIERNLYLTDIFAVLDTPPFIERAENPLPLNLSVPPTIEFKNVSFKYEGREDWILQDISLTIEPGEKIALVGMNGAGKSTLIKLLSRIYDPNKGEILVNGIDLRELDLDEWSSYISVLLQDYFNYELSVSESIGMGRVSTHVEEERVQSAAQYSGADEFINEWEHKYRQQLGKEFEEGIEPSKGQNQKIALARTIYRDGLVMVLDEPTAAIDALSEMKIFEQMEKAVGSHTLIVITHRFNTTKNMDKIVVMEKGHIEEIGSHADLIKKKRGLYRKMFDSQAKAFREPKPKSHTEVDQSD